MSKKFQRLLFWVIGGIGTIAAGVAIFLGLKSRKKEYVPEKDWAASTATADAADREAVASVEASDRERNKQTHEAVERESQSGDLNDALDSFRERWPADRKADSD